jgi:acid phosphatase (class A)
MKRRLNSLLFVIFCAGCPCLVFSADSAVQPAVGPAPSPCAVQPGHKGYLTGGEIAWADFPKGPAVGSEKDQLDLLTTLSIQASRTEDQKKEAWGDKDFSIKLVTDVIDPDFANRYPDLFQVLDRADDDVYFINSMLKRANHRLRPFAQHPALVLPLFTVGGFSYPSGHASGAELQARILGQLFPTQADSLLRRARQIADGRVIAGVHYATDTEAGIALGDLVFGELEANLKFKGDLSAAAAKDRIPSN